MIDHDKNKKELVFAQHKVARAVDELLQKDGISPAMVLMGLQLTAAKVITSFVEEHAHLQEAAAFGSRLIDDVQAEEVKRVRLKKSV